MRAVLICFVLSLINGIIYGSFMDIETKLQSFLEAGETMPHAYLFLGTARAGFDLAKDFAGKISKQPFPNIDTVFFDAIDGSGIEGIREVLQLAALMPVAAQKKVVLMTNMDLASPQMLNALLKTLEEPAKHTVFILLSSRPLLSTVMSRCQVIQLLKTEQEIETPTKLNETIGLLESNRSAGMAERMALVNILANLDDELLPQVIEHWLKCQIKELKQQPQKFKAVRATMETLQALRGNFNKKMVLQNFVTSGLV